jgi:hypothetical protein
LSVEKPTSSPLVLPTPSNNPNRTKEPSVGEKKQEKSRKIKNI